MTTGALLLETAQGDKMPIFINSGGEVYQGDYAILKYINHVPVNAETGWRYTMGFYNGDIPYKSSNGAIDKPEDSSGTPVSTVVIGYPTTVARKHGYL